MGLLSLSVVKSLLNVPVFGRWEELELIETSDYYVDTVSQRQGGVYYTSPVVADVMATWGVRPGTKQVLEPSFGSGVFLDAVARVSSRRGLEHLELHGVELMEPAYAAAVSSGLIDSRHAILRDFLTVKPFPVDLVVGNPPYVRLRSLSEAQRIHALELVRQALGTPMESAGSLWMPFVVHAIGFLREHGRLALVLPYELTYVHYARPLWRFLGENFGTLRIARVRERMFPKLMQEVVLLFADDYGATTDDVEFEAYDTTRDLAEGSPHVQERLSLHEIVQGERPFVRALLPRELTQLLDDRLAGLTAPVRDSCSFHIGYVSGQKAFFHPDQETVAKFRLPTSSLRKAITENRDLYGIGIHTSSISSDRMRYLFYPNDKLSTAEQAYIRAGERTGANKGYKCRNRAPWYVVPDVRKADLILSVFRESPSLVVNDGELLASNSLLCGFLHNSYSTSQFVAAWYTSLTLLACELQVHSLGGGVRVLIPGEVGALRIPLPRSLPTAHLHKLDVVLRTTTGNPYQLGDDPILIKTLGLTRNQVALIRHGASFLAGWRTATASS